MTLAQPRLLGASFYLHLLVTVLLTAALLVLPAAGEEKTSSKLVNINTATVEELARLPGVGEVIARRIVRHRARSGKFRKVEELLVIRGISAKKLDKLRPLITVGEDSAAESQKKPD